MMGSPFHNVEDKRMKLQGTICMWQGLPYMVLCDHPGNEVELYRLGEGTRLKVDYTDPDFNYKSVPLGYIDYGKKAYYLTRIPNRQNKAAVSQELIGIIPRQEMYVDNFYNTKAMENCVLGIYTSYDRACQEVVTGKSTSRAFGRRLAVSNEGRTYAINYRGRLIGHLGKQGVVQLLPSGDQSYMQQILMKAGVPCS
jgi:hypothetical protein